MSQAHVVSRRKNDKKRGDKDLIQEMITWKTPAAMAG